MEPGIVIGMDALLANVEMLTSLDFNRFEFVFFNEVVMNDHGLWINGLFTIFDCELREFHVENFLIVIFICYSDLSSHSYIVDLIEISEMFIMAEPMNFYIFLGLETDALVISLIVLIVAWINVMLREPYKMSKTIWL